METVKPVKVKIELKEITGCGRLQPLFELSVGDTSQQIYVKGVAEYESLDFSSNTSLCLTAYNAGKAIGSVKVSFGSLFSDKNTGKPDRWLKVKTEEFQNFRVKIVASINAEGVLIEKPKEKKICRPSTSKSEKVVECPYLNKLQNDHSTLTEPLDSLWKTRNLSDSSIKISLEPDSPLHQVNALQTPIESFSFDNLSSLNGIQLKQIVRTLCEEVKQLENIAQALPELNTNFKEKVSERKGTGEKARHEIAIFQSQWENEYKEINNLLQKRKDLKLNLADKQTQAKQLEIERDSLKSQLFDLQKQGNFSDVQQVYKNLIESSERHKAELQLKLAEEKTSMKESLSKTQSSIKLFSEEAEEIRKKIKIVSEECQKAKSENSQIKERINKIQAELENLQTVESKEIKSLQDLETETKLRDKTNEDLEKCRLEVKEDSVNLNEKFENLLKQKNKKKEESQDSSERLENAEKAVQKTQNQFFESVLQKISNEQICCLRADLSALISDLSQIHIFYSSTRPTLLPDLNTGSTLLSSSSEQVLLQSEKLDQLIESIDQKESELDSLKSTMNEVKKRQIFHSPVKSDPVDVALASFINSKEVPIKFTRQEGGNYLFGQTKIFIKLENSKLLVKVRGGFTPIEEFLSIYAPIELNRLQSPIGRSSISKS